MSGSHAESEKSEENVATSAERSKDVDVEKGSADVGQELRREVSGPPYSIFTSGQKIWIIFLVSVSALISPFGATTFLPALNVLSDVLHISPTQVNISITTYMVCGYSLEVMVLY